MKNLFISYQWNRTQLVSSTSIHFAEERKTSGISNIILTGDDAKISTESDIKTIEQYIELQNNYNEVKIINFRRME